MKLLKSAVAILLFFGFVEFTKTTKTEKRGIKKYGEKCKRRTFGSECIKGLECSKKQGICLKLEKQTCIQNNECISNKCVIGKCK